jgi:glycosyltransferase involved in cell wall biosynthesis
MISVTILTKNSAETLEPTLQSLRSFPEVLLFDTGSTDATLAIAKRYSNVKIIQEPFRGFGAAHNRATELASHDWILSIDSDEIVSPALADEILQLSLNKNAVYSLDRRNHFLGKRMKGCSGWYPDPVIRLYHRGATSFSHDAVHEKVITHNLKIVPLQGPLLHTPYRSIEDILTKMQHYSTLFARQHQGKKRSSLRSALGHGFAAFLKSYFLKRGFLQGKAGLIISIYNAHATYYKYLKLAFQNQSI